jgi:hypothetical protein
MLESQPRQDNAVRRARRSVQGTQHNQSVEIGVQRVLVFPDEGAAHDVAHELAGAGCRVVAVRAYGNFWDVSSLAVYAAPGEDPELLQPLLHEERLRLAALARSHGGALLTHVYNTAGGVPVISFDGIVVENPEATMALPDPLPGRRPQPPSAPGWSGLDFGDPRTEIPEIAAVARRMYDTEEAAPQLLKFLLSDTFAEELEECDDSTREFLADLVLMTDRMPTRDGGPVLIIPYLAELVRSEVLSPGARTSLLCVLLGFASELDAAITRSADWAAMRGGRVELRHVAALQEAAVAHIPRLVQGWERETGAARYILAALAAFCPTQTANFVLPRLADIPAPNGTDRADILDLASAVLAEDAHAVKVALRQIALWDSAVTEHLNPAAARATLANCVTRDLPEAVRLH